MPHKFAFEEGHIEAGGIVVDKLEQEHLHGQPVLILEVGLWDFCRKQTVGRRPQVTVNTR